MKICRQVKFASFWGKGLGLIYMHIDSCSVLDLSLVSFKVSFKYENY